MVYVSGDPDYKVFLYDPNLAYSYNIYIYASAMGRTDFIISDLKTLIVGCPISGLLTSSDITIDGDINPVVM